MMKLNLNSLKILREISILALLLFFASSVFAKNYDSVGTKSYNTAAECRKDINAGKIHCELDASCKIAVNEVHRCCTWVNADNTANNNQSFSFAPFNGSPSARNSAPGKRARKVNGKTKISHHDGYDYAMPQGTEVYAAADGKVSDVNECSGGAGRVIKILHLKAGSKQDYYTSVYMHLKSILVQKGNVVRKGQKIALSGGSNCSENCPGKPIDSGYECSNGKIIKSTEKASSGEKNAGYGPHLHFEVREGDSTQDRNAPVLDPACLANGNKVASNPTGYGDFDMTAEPQQTALPSTPYSKGCVYYFNEGNMVALSAVGESKGNPGIVNYYPQGGTGGNCYGNGKYAGRDNGGCSYGKNQMICGSVGASGNKTNFSGQTFPNFLTALSKENPELFNKLSGGKSLQETIQYACNDVKYPAQNKAFRDAWTKYGKETEAYQDAYITNNFTAAAQKALKNSGASISWNSLEPEIQMSIVASAIAGGQGGMHCKKTNGPCGATAWVNAVVKKCGADFSGCSKQELVHYLNEVRATKGYIGYGKDNPTYKAALKRAEADDALADKSMAIRQKLKENPGMTAEQAAKELYNQRLCKQGETPSSSTGSSSGKGDLSGSSSSQTGGSATATPESWSGGTQECNIDSYKSSYTECMFCDLFKILFETASSVAKKAFSALANAMSKLVLLGFAIWISITILKFISAMEQKEPRILIKTILNQAFVVLVVVIFLKSDVTTFFGMVMEPIFNTGMKLAQTVITDGNYGCKDFNIIDHGGLPISMGTNILCTIKAIQDQLLTIMALGSTSMCVGFFRESWHGIPIFPHLGYVIVGILLWISALLLMVIYPFLLIDSVLQLSVATALFPMAVAAYAFQITRKQYVGKIWETFLNCMFSFIFLSIIIFILTYMLSDIVTDSINGLEHAGTSSGFEIIIQRLAWWGTTFLKLVFVMLLGWAVLPEAKSFAGSFAGSIGVGKQDIGSNVGTLAMSGVKGVAKPTVLGAGRLVGKGASAVGNTAKEKINNARIGFQAWRMKNNPNATLDENGNIVVKSKSWFLRRNVTKVLSTDASGRQSISRTKTKGSGASTTTKTDTFFSVKEQRDKNGNVTSRQTEMKAAGGKYMINKDGSINQVALHAIRNGSTHDADTVNEALLNQMLAERMPGIEGATLNGSFSQRNVRNFKDDKGRDVFEVSQVNKDGTRSNFKMTLSGNRALTEYETITKKGEAVKYSSDGIVNKRSIYQYNKDGTNGEFGSVAQNTVKNNFSFTSYYNKMSGRPMDSLGNISNSVPKDEIMFGDEDMKAFQDQIARKGQSGPLGGFK
ncbi:MAG: M23 family metallopeptidase [Alphaproteobacteria bacterium]